MEREKDLERVEETWEEVGYKITALKNVVWVRTYPLPTTTESGIILTTKASSFYGSLPHVSLINAVVLASGPKTRVQVGDKVGFQRLFFAKYLEMGDGSLIGWIKHEKNLVGWTKGEITYAPMDANLKRAPRAPAGLGKNKYTFGG